MLKVLKIKLLIFKLKFEKKIKIKINYKNSLANVLQPSISDSDLRIYPLLN